MEFNRIILDADSLLYRCSLTAEKEEASHACQNIKSQIKRIKEYLRCDTMDIFIKGEDNFRDTLSTSAVYKGNRPAVRPRHLAAVTDYIISVHEAKRVNGMEADDACSVALYENSDYSSGVVLAAIDKDLWNTPGWHFNYDQRKWNVEYITVHEANRNFIRQILTGDKTDNIAGLPSLAEATRALLGLSRRRGVGRATAEALIRGVSNSEALERVWKAYEAFGAEAGWSAREIRRYFLEQGQLLWMARSLHCDGAPVLWEVPRSVSYWETQESA